MVSNPVLEISSQVESCLHSITEIWDDIGFDEPEREKRNERIVELVVERLEDIRKEERNTLKKLHRSIETNGEETVKLCRELGCEVENPAENISTLQLEQHLRYKVNELRKVIAERRKTMFDLQRREQELCERLQEDPTNAQKPIPSLEDLKFLETRIRTLDQEKVNRENSFRHLKGRILRLMEEMEQPLQANTSLESNLFCEEELVTLSTHNINLLKNYCCDLQKKLKTNEDEAGQLWLRIRQLWNRLNTDDHEQEDFEEAVLGFTPSTLFKLRGEMRRLEDLKMQNMSRFINQLRRELEQCWEDCFIGDEERNSFRYYFAEEYSEEVLNAHDEEVQRLRDYLAENENIFSKIKQHQELWNRLNILEDQANHPDRLFGNRGGALLEEEKERKMLSKKLPKVQEKLKEELLAWEAQHKKAFLVMGQPLEEYITSQWDNRNELKMQERIERKEAKQRQLDQESRLGSRTVSAAKRRIQKLRNDTLHSSKLRRTGENMRQPSSHGSTLSTINSTRSSKTSILSTPSKTMSVTPGRLPLREQNAVKTRSNQNTTVVKKETFGEISTYSQFTATIHKRSEHDNIRSSSVHNTTKTPLLVCRPTSRIPPRLPKTCPRQITRKSPRLSSISKSSKRRSPRNVSASVSRLGTHSRLGNSRFSNYSPSALGKSRISTFSPRQKLTFLM